MASDFATLQRWNDLVRSVREGPQRGDSRVYTICSCDVNGCPAKKLYDGFSGLGRFFIF